MLLLYGFPCLSLGFSLTGIASPYETLSCPVRRALTWVGRDCGLSVQPTWHRHNLPFRCVSTDHRCVGSCAVWLDIYVPARRLLSGQGGHRGETASDHQRRHIPEQIVWP